MNIGKICIVLFVLAALVTVFGDEGIVDYLSYRNKVRSLMAINEDTLKEKERLRKEIGMLKDLRYIEKLARHELGMVKENDFVYRFVEKELQQAR